MPDDVVRRFGELVAAAASPIDVTVQAQIARTELGVERVTIAAADTQVGSVGPSSASWQTYVTGGAVRAACEAVRSALFERAAARHGPGEFRLVGDEVESTVDGVVGDIASLLLDGPVERTAEWRHRPTQPLDEKIGRGNAHVQWAFCAHRAVVDVGVLRPPRRSRRRRGTRPDLSRGAERRTGRR